MFYTPQSAAEFGASPDLKQKMALVRQFCFDHGLLGANTKSVDDVAIRYPDGSVQGKADRVRLRFDLALHADGGAGKVLEVWPYDPASDLICRSTAKPGAPDTRSSRWTLFAAGPRGLLFVSHARHRENPEDRVMPTIAQWRTACMTRR